ncbi:hypothetical protein DA2_3227 [Desulfovibrio sp. A2]|nr:hypothetical protein DA2_3227 [Desulfovibrio sp. A2]
MRQLRTLSLLLLFCVLFTAGCSTKSRITPMGDAAHIPAGSTFSVGQTVDDSSFKFGEQDEKFSLCDTMSASLKNALVQEAMESAQGPLVIKTRILAYAPGNAFARWLVPGAGATKLSTESEVYAPDGSMLAKIPVERSIAAGGGYTIGAWKYVFDDVAKEIVAVLKKDMTAK